MEKSNQVKVYSMLKVLAILLVLISHATYYRVGNSFGGINYLELAPAGTSFKWYYLIDKIRYTLYLFHMPLFMAISGALFGHQVKRQRWQDVGAFAWAKWGRLMVPYLVFSLLYATPLKFVTGYFGEVSFLNGTATQLTLLGNSHLWYLYTLFVVSLVGYYLVPRFKLWQLVPLWGLHILSAYIGLSLVSLPLDFLLWYMVGATFEKHREELTDWLKGRRAFWIARMVGFAICVVVSLYVGRFGIPALQRIVNDLAAISGIALMYMGADWLGRQTSFLDKSWSQAILVNGLGIYIFSDPLNYLVLKVAYQVMGASWMLSLSGLLVLIVVRLLVTGLLGYLITILFAKVFPRRRAWVR